jgi:O-antigen biosynthesis protein WbqV
MAAGVAFIAGFILRMGDEATQYLVTSQFWFACALFMVITVVIASLFDLSRGVWRYTSAPDVISIAKIATLAVMIFALVMFLFFRLDAIPRTSLVISWCLLVLMMGGSRLAYRLWRSRRARMHSPEGARERVLLMGTGSEAETFIRATVERSDMPFLVCGVFDERGRRTGMQIRGVPVIGTLAEVGELLQANAIAGERIGALILTMPTSKVQTALMDELMNLAANHGIELRRLPQVTNPSGDSLRRIIPEQVSIEDILPRAAVSLDFNELRQTLEGRTIIVTGAGGSIGSQLCREIATCRPARLILLELSEFALYSIEQELSGKFAGTEVVARLCDVRDRGAVLQAFTELQPDFVFHAAALKHVPMVERQPVEGMRTNVLGSRNVADAANAAGARAMVMVSTDKAVNPTNVMGATKRAAELYCQSLDTTAVTRFVSVRFGNVLGSTGSVVPLFKRQIEAGGPVTVTHPEITRYFMTIPEASQLVLHALQLAMSGEESRGRIYVLDMGEPVKIAELARRMIILSGLRPGRDVEIVYSGLRPGEKLYEELFSDRERLAGTEAKSVLIASPATVSRPTIETFMTAAESAVMEGSSSQCVSLLATLVPEALLSVRQEPQRGTTSEVIQLPTGQRGAGA